MAVDANTGLIVASILTEQDVDDPSQVGPLLDQIEHKIGQVIADGAYDGEPTYETIAQHDSQIEVVIPARATAQPSAQFETDPTMRDTHLLMIQSLGRLGWQEACGYGHSVRWWRPRWAATRRSSVRDCVRVTGGASVLKRPSRWTSSTACWVLDARIPSALQPWRHKPHWGWGKLARSVIRATTPFTSQFNVECAGPSLLIFSLYTRTRPEPVGRCSCLSLNPKVYLPRTVRLCVFSIRRQSGQSLIGGNNTVGSKRRRLIWLGSKTAKNGQRCKSTRRLSIRKRAQHG